MVYDLCFVGDEGQSTASESSLARGSSPIPFTASPAYSQIHVSVLAAHCLEEISNFRQGKPFSDTFGVELLRRAILQGDDDAWTWLQQCLDEVVRSWLRRHPSRKAAYRLDSEENYVAVTFARFWQATTMRHLEFTTLAGALHYLRASLNSVILDTLRAYSRSKEVSLELSNPEELQTAEDADSSKVWEILKTMLPNMQEQRLAYLLFYCGLKPRQILRYCPHEFSDIQTIYRLRRNIMERLLRRAEQLRLRLDPLSEGRKVTEEALAL